MDRSLDFAPTRKDPLSIDVCRAGPSMLGRSASHQNPGLPQPAQLWQGRWLRPALLLLSLLAIFKGLHRPDRWGATQMETDYSAGFIKRGLFGQVLRFCHISHYNQIVVLSFAFTLVLVFELAFIAFQRLGQVTGSPWIGAVMMTSFGLTYLVSLSGHLEVFQAVMAIAVLTIRRTRFFLPAAIAASILGLFIHELFLLVFVPLFILRALLDIFEPLALGSGADSGTTLRRALTSGKTIGLAALIAIPVVTALLISAAPALTPSKISLLRQSMIARLDFPPREWLFAVFARGIGDNFRLMAHLAHSTHYWNMQMDSLCLFGPVTAFFIAVSLRQVRQWSQQGVRILFRVIVWVASLSPLSLHVQGFDGFRFNSLVALTAFLVMAILIMHPGLRAHSLGASPVIPPAWTGMAAFLIALNMGSGIGLLDSQQVQLFPQLESLRDGLNDCRDILHHRPLAPPYEPWREWKWDPLQPKVSGFQCLDNCPPPGTAIAPPADKTN